MFSKVQCSCQIGCYIVILFIFIKKLFIINHAIYLCFKFVAIVEGDRTLGQHSYESCRYNFMNIILTYVMVVMLPVL